jgi:RNA polymerase sigma factor, sigma-70 family
MTDNISQSKSFKVFVREVSPYLFSLSYRLTGSYDDALDLLQDTFLKVWSNWEQLKDAEKALPWVRKICVNQYIDLCRKSKRNYLVKDPVFPHMEYEIISNAPTPEDEVLADEEVRLIHSQCWTVMTRTLSLYQQIVFVMTDIYQLKIDETAQLIGRSEAATKSLLHRARKSMNGLLSPFCSLVQKDNICTCKSWIQYSHDIQKRREFLNQMVASRKSSGKDTSFAENKLITLFNNLPQHVPPLPWIEKIEKNI